MAVGDDDTLGILGDVDPDDPRFDDDPDDDLDPDDDPNRDSTYLKFEFEGLDSLEALAARARALAEDWEAKAAAGWRLSEPVDGGHVNMELAPPPHEH